MPLYVKFTTWAGPFAVVKVNVGMSVPTLVAPVNVIAGNAVPAAGAVT